MPTDLPLLVTVDLGADGVVTVQKSEGIVSLTTSIRRESPAPGASTAERIQCSLYNMGVDAIEAVIMGHVTAGVVVDHPAYIEGIKTALHALADHI